MDNAENKGTRLDKLRTFWKWIYKLRSVILAIPVAVVAAILAVRNMATLPDVVGINMQASGEYAQAISKSVAVMGPLAITAVCLLLTFCSRKVLYPWLISVFSLVLPLLLMFSSSFPS